ncbi:MAG: PilZ domain-containing protein [Candidatus Omnitrophica bacterium]|nr:PilZ domain-containing protein [Candidatus Omnitrophota bacterium]
MGRVERRKSIRFSKEVTLRFVIFDSFASDERKEDLRPREGKISNISAGGVRISTSDLDEKDLEVLKSNRAKLALRFSLEEKSCDIDATARVKWMVKANINEEGKSKFVIGLEFLDISSEDRNRIGQFIISQRFPSLH